VLKSTDSDVEVSLSVRTVSFLTNVADASRHITMQTLNDNMPKNSLRAELSGRLHRIASDTGTF